MNKLQVAYIAGFFDGEGSIFIAKGRKSYHYFLCLNLSNANSSVLEFARKLTGKGVLSEHSRGEGQSQSFMLRYSSNEAAEFLQKILPYLRIQKEQAKLAIEFQNRMSNELHILSKEIRKIITGE